MSQFPEWVIYKKAFNDGCKKNIHCITPPPFSILERLFPLSSSFHRLTGWIFLIPTSRHAEQKHVTWNREIGLKPENFTHLSFPDFIPSRLGYQNLGKKQIYEIFRPHPFFLIPGCTLHVWDTLGRTETWVSWNCSFLFLAGERN